MKIHLQSKTMLKSVYISAILVIMVVCTTIASAGDHKYPDSWGKAGYTVELQNNSKVLINYSVGEFVLTDFELNGESLLGRPFGIGKGSESFDFMIKEANQIKNWPKNKIKELREVVYKGKGAEEMFFCIPFLQYFTTTEDRF